MTVHSQLSLAFRPRQARAEVARGPRRNGKRKKASRLADSAPKPTPAVPRSPDDLNLPSPARPPLTDPHKGELRRFLTALAAAGLTHFLVLPRDSSSRTEAPYEQWGLCLV